MSHVKASIVVFSIAVFSIAVFSIAQHIGGFHSSVFPPCALPRGHYAPYTVYGLYTQYTSAPLDCIWFIHSIHLCPARLYMVDIVPHGRWLPGGHVLLRQSCCWWGSGKLSISKLVMAYSKEKNIKNLEYKYKHKKSLFVHVLLR